MKVLLINVVCGINSTGRICTDIAEKLEKEGHTVKIAYGRGTVPNEYQKFAVKIGSDFSIKEDAIKTRIFDNAGFNSASATQKFIKWVKFYNPDLIHLHNLHGYYINVKILFDYLKTCDKKIVWTLHDCWAFTGHCAYFSYVRCDKWKTGCYQCEQLNSYPQSWWNDHSKENWYIKKSTFTGVPNMSLIVPSEWLEKLVKQSYLKEYPVQVVYNTINQSIFKPTSSNFRKMWNLEREHILLGVASSWSSRKGLETFVQLASSLDSSYKIVLVGLNVRQKKSMPKNILCLDKTNSAEELAKIYSAADLFVNPSVEETFGMTTLEAISCGTQALVFQGTACEEVAKKNNGIIVRQDFDSILNAIKYYFMTKNS